MRNLCPGKIPNPVSSSGAPRKIDGMKSKNVWVMAIEVIKISNVVMGRVDMRGIDIVEIAIRLI